MNEIDTEAPVQPKAGKVCLAIGVFDGVHLGHQQIIRQTIADAGQHEATAVVVTFDKEKLKTDYLTRDISYKTAMGRAKAAKGELEVQINKAEGEKADAQLVLDLAILDRDKYLQGEYQKVVSTNTPFTADINGLAPSSTDKQIAVTAGIRHRF